jgi:hypothetical protein
LKEAPPVPRSGLTVEQHPAPGCGWQVVHDLSRLPFSFQLRLRRQADALYGTGVDFTASVTVMKAHPQWPEAARLSAEWDRRSRGCCDAGEHYSPFTYAASGRCYGGGQPRRS